MDLLVVPGGRLLIQRGAKDLLAVRPNVDQPIDRLGRQTRAQERAAHGRQQWIGALKPLLNCNTLYPWTRFKGYDPYLAWPTQ